MWPVLLRFPWDGVKVGGVTIPLFGWGVFLGAWAVFGAVQLVLIRKQRSAFATDDYVGMGIWTVVAAVLINLPQWGPKFAPVGLPVFGYGFMLFVGVSLATLLAAYHSRKVGLPDETIWDLAVWLFVAGIAGARIFYCVQKYDDVFAGRTGMDWLFAAVNLSNGGVVLYGAIIGGLLSFLTFCWVRKISPWILADVVAPSLLLGMGLGRIGCLLYGCCYGDRCDLPWAISFPQEGMPYGILLQQGFIGGGDLRTPLLHPTQIYGAIDGLLLAGLMTLYFPYRRKNGEVLLIGWLAYPITRFLVEFLRGDELGQFGTSLTISQWISVILFVGAVVFAVVLMRRPTLDANHPRELASA